jgi:hypothetical protein
MTDDDIHENAVELEWQLFMKMVFPQAKEGSMQYSEIRRIFLAGVVAVRNVMLMIECPDTNEEDAAKLVADVMDVADNFLTELRRDEAERN